MFQQKVDSILNDSNYVFMQLIHFVYIFSEGKNNGGSKRYSRKREPSFPKTDSFTGPRRTNSQKSKNFDKRPPQRGGGRQYGVTGGGRREEVGFFETFISYFSCF